MAVSGLLSKHIKFKIGAYTGSSVPSTYTVIEGLQEIPSLGGTPDKVDITTLDDEAKRNLNGLKDYGDLAFKFLFDNSGTDSNYRALKAMETDTNGLPKKCSIKIEFPDAATTGSGTHAGTTFTFDANVVVSPDGVGVNAPVTFTCTAALLSDINVTNPS